MLGVAAKNEGGEQSDEDDTEDDGDEDDKDDDDDKKDNDDDNNKNDSLGSGSLSDDEIADAWDSYNVEFDDHDDDDEREILTDGQQTKKMMEEHLGRDKEEGDFIGYVADRPLAVGEANKSNNIAKSTTKKSCKRDSRRTSLSLYVRHVISALCSRSRRAFRLISNLTKDKQKIMEVLESQKERIDGLEDHVGELEERIDSGYEENDKDEQSSDYELPQQPSYSEYFLSMRGADGGARGSPSLSRRKELGRMEDAAPLVPGSAYRAQFESDRGSHQPSPVPRQHNDLAKRDDALGRVWRFLANFLHAKHQPNSAPSAESMNQQAGLPMQAQHSEAPPLAVLTPLGKPLAEVFTNVAFNNGATVVGFTSSQKCRQRIRERIRGLQRIIKAVKEHEEVAAPPHSSEISTADQRVVSDAVPPDITEEKATRHNQLRGDQRPYILRRQSELNLLQSATLPCDGFQAGDDASDAVMDAVLSGKRRIAVEVNDLAAGPQVRRGLSTASTSGSPSESGDPESALAQFIETMLLKVSIAVENIQGPNKIKLVFDNYADLLLSKYEMALVGDTIIKMDTLRSGSADEEDRIFVLVAPGGYRGGRGHLERWIEQAQGRPMIVVNPANITLDELGFETAYHLSFSQAIFTPAHSNPANYFQTVARRGLQDKPDMLNRFSAANVRERSVAGTLALVKEFPNDYSLWLYHDSDILARSFPSRPSGYYGAGARGVVPGGHFFPPLYWNTAPVLVSRFASHPSVGDISDAIAKALQIDTSPEAEKMSQPNAIEGGTRLALLGSITLQSGSHPHDWLQDQHPSKEVTETSAKKGYLVLEYADGLYKDT